MRIELPENVKMIHESLFAAGYDVYAVGGCVRDTILGRTPGDWDMTTDALPEDIKRVFRYTVDTGIEHGTVTVLIYGAKGESPDTYEVTTYRIDGEYLDGRHPEHVIFTDSLREDLRRRDFTINAMAYNEKSGLKDYFGGQEDLKAGLIRCVGIADERFDEDALRILRAVRFAAQLGFTIEHDTREAIVRHAAHLDAVSKERILTEITKLICSSHIEIAGELFDLKLIDHIADGFEDIKPLPESIKLPAVSTSERHVRFAFLMRGMSSKKAAAVLRNLKADNDTVHHASLLAENVMRPLPSDIYEFKKIISKMTLKDFEDLLYMKKTLSPTDEYRECCSSENIDECILLYKGIIDHEEPIYMKDLVVTGNDLRKAGVPEGPALGRILNMMLDDVRRNPDNNSVLYLFSKYLH